MPKQTFFNLDDAKRRHIENCAMEEFEHYIYANASINRIVKNAGIAKGSFYQYFEDKMDLAIHILTLLADKETSYVEEKMSLNDAVEDDFFLWLKQQVQISIEFGIENSQYIAIYRSLMMSDEMALQKKMAEVTMTMGTDFYRDKIKWHMENGNLRDDISPDFLGEYLMMIIYSLIDGFFRKSSNELEADQTAINKMIDQVLDFTENGLKKQGGDNVRNKC